MSEINIINAIDGNQYLVNQTGSVSGSSSSDKVSFDDVYNSQNQTETLEDIFKSVSDEYGVPVKLLKAVAQAESSFDTNAVSGCGASGIMQLMPETAKSLGVEDVFDAKQNITGGAKMLAYLLDDYNGNTTLALAAYNAGSGNVAKYGGVPPFEETRNYIAKINDILDGELETDTSSISIAKNASTATQAAGTTASGTATAGVATSATSDIPVRIVDTKTQAAEALSYEDYLRFLEIYENLATAVFKDSSADKNQTSILDNQNGQNTQQNFYELQQAKFNSRARSLLEI